MHILAPRFVKTAMGDSYTYLGSVQGTFRTSHTWGCSIVALKGGETSVCARLDAADFNRQHFFFFLSHPRCSRFFAVKSIENKKGK